MSEEEVIGVALYVIGTLLFLAKMKVSKEDVTWKTVGFFMLAQATIIFGVAIAIYGFIFFIAGDED